MKRFTSGLFFAIVLGFCSLGGGTAEAQFGMGGIGIGVGMGGPGGFRGAGPMMGSGFYGGPGMAVGMGGPGFYRAPRSAYVSGNRVYRESSAQPRRRTHRGPRRW
jgi:hypothetical protein